MNFFIYPEQWDHTQQSREAAASSEVGKRHEEDNEGTGEEPPVQKHRFNGKNQVEVQDFILSPLPSTRS